MNGLVEELKRRAKKLDDNAQEVLNKPLPTVIGSGLIGSSFNELRKVLQTKQSDLQEKADKLNDQIALLEKDKDVIDILTGDIDVLLDEIREITDKEGMMGELH